MSIFPFDLGKPIVGLIILASFSGCANELRFDSKVHTRHTFHLKGGYFYGPGPIQPDTSLPDGELQNVVFDQEKFFGFAEFYNDGTSSSFLSDKRTRINQNIQAGIIDLSDGSNPVLLVAVDGGPNDGKEKYYLDENYALNWRVDLALDPGFPEGIVRVDNFVLTTGIVEIQPSAQTEAGMPGGYDQAGSKTSGSILAGRVGDFDFDGYVDGILVAAPRVPLDSAMLPGAPVGNKRGFSTDIRIDPSVALTLTLRGIVHYEESLNELADRGETKNILESLEDIRVRLNAAERNLADALIFGKWSSVEWKQRGFTLNGRLETLKTLNSISFSLLSHYPTYGKQISKSARDSIEKFYNELHSLIKDVEHINESTNSVSFKLQSSA